MAMQLLLILLGVGVLALIALVVCWLRRHGDQVAAWMEGDSGDGPAPSCCLTEEPEANPHRCCEQRETPTASEAALAPAETQKLVARAKRG